MSSYYTRKNSFRFALCMLIGIGTGSGYSIAKGTKDMHHTVVNPASAHLVVGADVMDLSVLPKVKGNVAQYLPTPYGNLGGLLLTDGTQVIFSTMFGEAIKTLVRPGQDITIRGLKAHSLPLVQAFLIENQRGKKIQEDSPEAGFSPVPTTGPDLYVNGRIERLLHNLQGQIMGMTLKDGTVIYIVPSDLKKLSFELAAGKTIYARGMGSVSALGKALQARLLGNSETNMVELSQFNAPPFGAPAGSPAYDYIPQ
ncbi:hypothetical protein [Commensalibacter oyaizuii]|uniref:Uncharacterized protein n=1 Tax=Commensalibacter oyaizuii TaxID=3043873 RepID=A0ABT6Q215_9PROT|nr:hypothetical protein [Commensalibacter sp. TBRC 16381]MDI2091157.1 hypothetical protein [Commensalibacter sp. TBRC 16381]